MNRNILNQAFITMGYRQMTDVNTGNIYGKPVGFGIIVAKIENNHKEVTFKSLFRNYTTGKTQPWLTSKMNIDYTDPKVGYETVKNEELYNKYVNDIAQKEAEHGNHVYKLIYNYGSEYNVNKTFAFQAKNDIMSMFNL